MKAIFIELPPFERLRDEYFDDESFKDLQNELMRDPVAGAVIQGGTSEDQVWRSAPGQGKARRPACDLLLERC